MSLLAECADVTTLPPIAETGACPFTFKEILRLAGALKTADLFTEATIKDIDTWTDALTAKTLSLSPEIYAGKFNSNEAVYSDAAQNRDGFRRVIDETKPSFEASAINIAPTTYVPFKKMGNLTNGQSGKTNLQVFFLLTGDRVAVRKIGTGAQAKLHGTDFYAMFVTSPNLDNKDMTSRITADLSEDWFNDIEIIKVDFDLRTLINPAA